MILKSMFHEGVVSVVDGVMGSGKTDITGLLMFLSTTSNHPTCANTKGTLPGVVQIGTDIELFRFVIKYGKGVLFLDEMNVVTTSKQAGSYTSRYLELIVALCRKLHLAVVFVIQRTGNLLPMIREMTTYELIKIDIDNMLVVTPEMEFQVGDIPSCTEYGMMFDTYAFSGFKFLIDIEALFQEMTDYSYEEAMQRMKILSENDFREYWRKDTTEEMFDRMVNKTDRRKEKCQARVAKRTAPFTKEKVEHGERQKRGVPSTLDMGKETYPSATSSKTKKERHSTASRSIRHDTPITPMEKEESKVKPFNQTF